MDIKFVDIDSDALMRALRFYESHIDLLVKLHFTTDDDIFCFMYEQDRVSKIINQLEKQVG